jgi:CIC family chloride channel protein
MLLIGCAASASLAALFKAPVAAIIFAVEVIMIDLTAASLVPLLLASLAGLITASLFQGQNDILTISNLAVFEMKTLPWYFCSERHVVPALSFFPSSTLGASHG